MAASPTPGKPSLLSKNEVCAALAARCRVAPLSTLIAALRPDADLHLVGGVVRDTFLNTPNSDADLSTALQSSEAIARLTAAGIRSLEVGAKHGTVIAIINEQQLEVSTFRIARGNGTVEYGATVTDDLQARDFTVNAIAYSVNTGELIDPLQGITDLSNGIARGCADPALRFREDPLRIMRAVRFGPAQGRTIDSDTRTAAHQHRELLRKVSAERIRNELERILLSPLPRQAFRELRDLELLPIVLPEMLASVGVAQNSFHIEDVFEHTLSVIERAPRERLMRWMALFHDLGKPATLSVGEDGERHFYGHEKVSEQLALAAMERMKFSTDDTRAIALVVRQHMRPVSCGPSGVRRILRDLGPEYDRWRAFKNADAPPALADAVVLAELAEFDEKVMTERNRPKGSVFSGLALDGSDLIAIGVKPGPVLGGILKQLHEQVLDDPDCNEKELLLERAKALIVSHGTKT